MKRTRITDVITKEEAKNGESVITFYYQHRWGQERVISVKILCMN